MKCALIKLNAFIICEMLPPWIKALAIILRILSATLLSKAVTIVMLHKQKYFI